MNARIYGPVTLTVATLAVPAGVIARDGAAQAPVVRPAATSAPRESAALFVEMGKVIQSPRCMNCHPRTDSPTQGDAMILHNPPMVRGPDGHGPAGMECATCHGSRNVNFVNGVGSVPGNSKWSLAPREMAWQGKTLRQICEQIKDPRRNGGKSLNDLVVHNATDSLVGWGWHPGKGRTPAPGTQAQFGAITKRWVESGARCPA